MHTIDSMIEWLETLRSVSTLGGKTPVVIEVKNIPGVYENVAAQLLEVTNKGPLWQRFDSNNDQVVVRMF